MSRCAIRPPRSLRSSSSSSAGSLSGRTAIVTGSTSGIGLGIARSLLGAGANVMLNGFGSPAEIEKLRATLAEEFEPAGCKIAYSPADMASAEQIHQMVDDTVSKLGSLDILINKSVTTLTHTRTNSRRTEHGVTEHGCG